MALLAQCVKESPRDIHAIYLSGIGSARSGNYAAAEKFFRKAVKLNKDMFQAYVDLGMSQSYQGKYSDAIQSFKRSLAIKPNFAPAHCNLALTCLKTGEAARALKHANKAVALDSTNPVFLDVQGQCYRQLEQTDKAIETFTSINNAHPKFYNAFLHLYETYRLIEDTSGAEQILLSAKQNFVNEPKIYLTLGGFYEQTNHSEQARDTYIEGLEHCTNNPELMLALGRAYRMLGEFDKGMEQVDNVVAAHPAYQPAITERCSFHFLKKEYEEAHGLMAGFIAANPEITLTPGLSMAYAQACRLTGRHEDSIGTLRATLQTTGITEEMQSVIHFSMGDTFDKMTKYDQAFSMYRKANGASKGQSDLGRYLAMFDDISGSIKQEHIDNATRSDVTSRKPVFIVGMPRSGTSLTEQIIASHPEAYGAGEITELWSISQDICGSTTHENYSAKLAQLGQDQIDRFARRYLSFIETLDPNASRITDKLPHNFFHIGLIRQLFPNARIIHCHRHPFDTCLSIYFKKFNDSHRYARDLSEIARFYQRYQQLMDLWGDTDADILSLRYEDLVSDQERLSRDIISFIGLEWDDECLRYYESERLITTPSYTQANKPIYSDAVNRWQNYHGKLQPLIDVLGSPEQYVPSP